MPSNNELVDCLVRRGTLRTPPIITSFQAIDRRYFVQIASLSLAYEDYPLDIGYEVTISQPTTVAFMLETLAPKQGEKVLDIGSGSGWTTALLAHIVGATGAVYGVEIVPALVIWGSNNLKKYPFSNAEIVQAEGKLGLKRKAPFDKILVSASTRQLPEELITQLKVGGTLVIPIGEAIWQVHKTSATQYNINKYPGFVFVPLQR
jgi:protein-L-isoaspartate(D-aspartate) O-methyltransferase